MNKITFFMCLAVLMLILSACAPALNATNIDIPTRTVSRISSPEPTLLSTPTPSSLPTSTMASTHTPQMVTVAALKGNLFIRRGPDLAYNAISALLDGQSVTAHARDVLGKWLQVSLPDHPEEIGWISIQSHYTLVNGDVKSLPAVEPADWPVLASVRNCTYHEMRVDPIGIVITTADNFPWNDVQIDPGVYTIHDIEVHGSPLIMEIEIKEGSQIEIHRDGDGQRWKCSTP